MIFKSFTFEPDLYSNRINIEINNFISINKANGLEVVDKSVVGGRQGDNSLIKGVVTVILWMDKKEVNHD